MSKPEMASWSFSAGATSYCVHEKAECTSVFEGVGWRLLFSLPATGLDRKLVKAMVLAWERAYASGVVRGRIALADDLRQMIGAASELDVHQFFLEDEEEAEDL